MTVPIFVAVSGNIWDTFSTSKWRVLQAGSK